MAHIVRKSTAHKESSQEKSHVQEQSLMAVSNHQAGWGKMAQHRLWARCGFYRRGRLRKLADAQWSLVGWGCLRAWDFLLRGGAAILARSQNGKLLLYHSPIFSLVTMRVKAEDRELGRSVGLLAASCWPGALY
jgi:hypothetical protein